MASSYKATIPLTELIICTLCLLPRLAARVKPTARIPWPIFKVLFWFLRELAHTLRSSRGGSWSESIRAGERPAGRSSGNCRSGAVHKASGTSNSAKGRLNTPGKPRKQRRRGKKDGDDKKKPPDQSINPDTDHSSSPFACPFYLHDRHVWHNCLRTYTLTRIVDVRQHLLRAHLLPPRCPNCGQEFEDEADEGSSAENRCDAHIQLQNCQQLPSPLPPRHGVTGGQYQTIRNIATRRTGRRGSDSPTTKWFEIWDIIFPNTPRPDSPYITEHPDVQRVIDMTQLIFSGELWRSLILPSRGSSPSLPNTTESRRTAVTIADRLIAGFRRIYQSPGQETPEAAVNAVPGIPVPGPVDDALQQGQAWEILSAPSQPAQATEDPLLLGHTTTAAAGDSAWMTQQSPGYPSSDRQTHYNPMAQARHTLSPLVPDQDFLADTQGSMFSFEGLGDLTGIEVPPRPGSPSQHFNNNYGSNTSGFWGHPGADEEDDVDET